MTKEVKKKVINPPKKPKLQELREKLSIRKQELSALTPMLANQLKSEETKRADTLHEIQSRVARDVKPLDVKKRGEIEAAKLKLDKVKAAAQLEYEAAEAAAAIERKEATESAKQTFNEACEEARSKFNSQADGLLRRVKKEKAAVEKTHKRMVGGFKDHERETRKETVEEIEKLEANIAIEVDRQKKAFNKKGKSKPAEAQA